MLINNCLIQPIFAPDKRRFERNVRSLESLSTLSGHGEQAVQVVFGGWNTGFYFTELVAIIRKSFPHQQFDVLSYPANLGKAHIVNDLYKTVSDQLSSSGRLFLIDSDMVFVRPADEILSRALMVGSKFEEAMGRPLGLLAFQQEGQNCHLPETADNRAELRLQDETCESVVYPNEPSGIAGGAIMVDRTMWERVGGYRQMGVYAGEDAWLLRDIGDAGACYGIMENLAVLHPHDHDEAYAIWKRSSAHTFNASALNSFEESRADADQFWRLRLQNS